MNADAKVRRNPGLIFMVCSADSESAREFTAAEKLECTPGDRDSERDSEPSEVNRLGLGRLLTQASPESRPDSVGHGPDSEPATRTREPGRRAVGSAYHDPGCDCNHGLDYQTVTTLTTVTVTTSRSHAGPGEPRAHPP